MGKKLRKHLHHCAKSITCVTGVVMIWYGIGWMIDYIAQQYFPNHGGIVGMTSLFIGFAILYLPDGDLDELV